MKSKQPKGLILIRIPLKTPILGFKLNMQDKISRIHSKNRNIETFQTSRQLKKKIKQEMDS